jgi:3-oxoadipate enol-lactonase
VPYAPAEDVELYYEVHGKGEPLILIMGLSLNSMAWYRSLPRFAERFQVIVFDNRGVGRSGKPDIPYTTDRMAEDTVKVLDHAGIERTHVYGISMGGMIAQRFAVKFPDRVRSLILGCTTPGGIYQIQPSVKAVQVLLRHAFGTPEELARAMIPILYSEEFVQSHPDLIEQDVQQALAIPTPTHGFLRQLEACLNHDSYHDLPTIQAPTLILHGEKDILLPYGNAQILAEQIPHSRLLAFPNAGHMYLTEVDEAADQAVMDFLSTVSNE